jgi:hypothetical protein
MEIRREVMAFARVMEAQLRKHDEKRGATGWKDGDPCYIAHRMLEEMGEVVTEMAPEDPIGRYLLKLIEDHFTENYHLVKPRHPDKLVLELADMANLAMMLADVTCEDFCPDDDDRVEG